jgi:photosystem II stability/assembly factor-like uncharacterized protein
VKIRVPLTKSAMKKSILIFLYSLLTVHGSLSQQYSWTNISANLPDFYNDTVIINGGADTLIANISGISFLDNNHGWICTYHPFDGEPSAVLETTDGGLTWTEHSAPYAGADIHMIDEQNGYFGAINGFVYKTIDGAESWTFHGLLTVALYDLEFPPRPAQTGYAGGKDGHLSQITPEGVFPYSLGLNGSVYCMSFPTEEQGWALLDYQLIIRYIDGNWISDSSHPFSSKSWLYCFDNQLGWCVGDRFLLTTNGIDWVQVDPNFIQTGAMMGVYFTDVNNGWAVGTQGQIAYSHDGGNDWTMLEHNLTDEILTGVLFTSPNNGYIIGGEKTLLKYTAITGEEEQGVGEAGKLGGVEVWPNPTRGEFKIQSSKFKINEVEVVDLLGNVVMEAGRQGSGEAGKEFDISYLPAGVYLVRIYFDNKMIVKKMIKL